MLRALFRRRFKDNMSGIQIENQVYSIPFENPEIEKELRAGGFGETGFEVRELIGVEVENNAETTPSVQVESKSAPAGGSHPDDEQLLDDVALLACYGVMSDKTARYNIDLLTRHRVRKLADNHSVDLHLRVVEAINRASAQEDAAPKPKDPTDEIPHGAIIGMLDDVTLIAHCSADSATLCLSERSRSLAIKALTRPYLSKRYAGMSSQERSQQAYGAIKIAAVVCPELRASLQTPDWAKRT